MNLFIDSISNPGAIIGFSSNQKIFSHLSIDIVMNESSKLIGYIDTFLKDHKTTINDVKNIIVVHGPGSFTGVRTTVLIANTFAFRSHITLTPVSYFDLFSNYPIIKQSSKRDVFIKKDKNSEVEILSNTECLEYIERNKIEKIYGDFDIFLNMPTIKEEAQSHINIEPISKVDYKNIIFGITLENKKQIEPLYIKKPNIN